MSPQPAAASPDVIRDFERVPADVVRRAAEFASSISPTSPAGAARCTTASRRSRRRCASPVRRLPSRSAPATT